MSTLPRRGGFTHIFAAKYPTPLSDLYLKQLAELQKEQNGRSIDTADLDKLGTEHDDTPDVPFRPNEKRRLDWSGKTCAFLSPSLIRILGLTLPTRPRTFDDSR